MQLYIKYKNTIVWKSRVQLIDMRRGELPAVIVGLKKQTNKQQQQQQQQQHQRISRLAVPLVVLCVLLA